MAEAITWIAVLIFIGVIVILYLKGEREARGIRGGSRLRALFDPQEREKRQACQEEWNGVVLFMFPQDPWTARK